MRIDLGDSDTGFEASDPDLYISGTENRPSFEINAEAAPWNRPSFAFRGYVLHFESMWAAPRRDWN